MGEARPRQPIDASTPEGTVAGRIELVRHYRGRYTRIDVAGSPEDDAVNGQSLIGDGRDHQGRGLATAMWDSSQEMCPGRSTPRTERQGKDWPAA